jgi:hypothetical protein
MHQFCVVCHKVPLKFAGWFCTRKLSLSAAARLAAFARPLASVGKSRGSRIRLVSVGKSRLGGLGGCRGGHCLLGHPLAGNGYYDPRDGHAGGGTGQAATCRASAASAGVRRPLAPAGASRLPAVALAAACRIHGACGGRAHGGVTLISRLRPATPFCAQHAFPPGPAGEQLSQARQPGRMAPLDSAR